MANNWHVRALAMAIASAATVSGGAWAMPFETGNPDLEVRFDNTIKYNLMSRVRARTRSIKK